jgi:hypothetical protein
MLVEVVLGGFLAQLSVSIWGKALLWWAKLYWVGSWGSYLSLFGARHCYGGRSCIGWVLGALLG